MPEVFKVGLTRDFLRPDGSFSFGDIGLDVLDQAPGVTWEFLAEDTPELRPDQLEGYDALLLLGSRVTSSTLEGQDRLTLVARLGVGYDNVDVPACNAHDVLLTITPDGVRRPVAASVLLLMLALAHKLFLKDSLTRAGRWAEKIDYMGNGLTGRTLGIIGLGNIGREVVRLVRPLDMRFLASDPYLTHDQAVATGAELVDLETLLRRSDYVSVNCPLNVETRHLLNRERLALMKPTAYLINTARGPIVDQQALYEVLREGRIAGAGLDVFDQEPIDADDPLLKLDSVIVTPHAICWTDECFLGMGRNACESILDVAAGRVPRHVVNREVLERAGLKAKLAGYSKQSEPV
jgi:phosphoglycerate dehydrogenase-like enzyme